MSKTYPPLSFLPTLRRAVLALVFALWLLLPLSASAQSTATISGRVTNAENEPVEGVYIYLYKSNDIFWDPVSYDNKTDQNGEYSYTGLSAGTYRLAASPIFNQAMQYLGRYYDNQTSLETATDIVITQGATLTGYDMILPRNGLIRGKVVASDGTPMPGIVVSTWSRHDFGAGPTYSVDASIFTDENGDFAITVVNSNPHWLSFHNSSAEVSEYYDNKPNIESADPISLSTNEVISITAVIGTVKKISGTVVDRLGVPVANAWVSFYKRNLFLDGDNWYSGPVIETDVNGYYQFEDLPHAFYRVQFNGPPILEEYYHNSESFEDADVLDLTTGPDAVTIDAEVTRRGVITGTVVDIEGAPIKHVNVKLILFSQWQWIKIYSVYTDVNGNYALLSGLPDREYRVDFDSNGPYAREYYPDSYWAEAAQAITIPLETTIPNINATLRRVNEVEADFSGIPISGTVPFTVSFGNQSKGTAISHAWNFGDGTTSTEISPTHTYTQAGIYTVTLTVVGAENQHTEIKKSYISAVDTPITQLGIQQSTPGGNPQAQPKVGETIHFSATAAGSNVEYLWDFGDDAVVAASTATGQYVQHAYDAPGDYIVTLTASNGADEEVTTMPITIQDADDEEPNAEEPVSALALHGPNSAPVNASISLSATVGAGDNVTYSWDFGDGENGTGVITQHTYSEAGMYTITLTASNEVSEEVVTREITIQESEDIENVLRLPSLHVSP